MSGTAVVQCPECKPHTTHQWGAGDHALCPGITWVAYHREANRTEFVGGTATYNGRRVTIVDADDSGCVQIALWVNRDHVEVDMAGDDCGHRVGPVAGCAGSRCEGEAAITEGMIGPDVAGEF